jgi:hypothetical protein
VRPLALGDGLHLGALIRASLGEPVHQTPSSRAAQHCGRALLGLFSERCQHRRRDAPAIVRFQFDVPEHGQILDHPVWTAFRDEICGQIVRPAVFSV